MYEDKRLPEFEELKEIAWQISSKSAGHKAGFVLASGQKSGESEHIEEEQPEEVPVAGSENK